MELQDLNVLQAYSVLIEQWKGVAMKVIDQMPTLIIQSAWNQP